ncbi:MAG: zinc ribbon domain-containing protein [candidate division WOR-3 bacterium]
MRNPCPKKKSHQRVLRLVVIFMLLTLSSCIEVDWKLHFNPDGSGVAELKFINQSVPTFNFKRDLEGGSQWIAKLYKMGGTSVTGQEQGREHVLYRVPFSSVSDLSDEDLAFSFTKYGDTCEFRLEPKRQAQNQAAGQALPISFSLSVALPGEIKEATGGAINGNLVTWNTTLAELLTGSTKLYARSELPTALSRMKGMKPVGINLLKILILGGIVLAGLLAAIRIRSRTKSRKQAAIPGSPSRFCGHCGGSVGLTARFCGNCGKQLNQAGA